MSLFTSESQTERRSTSTRLPSDSSKLVYFYNLYSSHLCLSTRRLSGLLAFNVCGLLLFLWWTEQISFCLYMEFRSLVYYKDKIVILLSSFKKLESILWARIYFTFMLVCLDSFIRAMENKDVVSCPWFQEVGHYNTSFQTSVFLEVPQSFSEFLRTIVRNLRFHRHRVCSFLFFSLLSLKCF